MKERLILFAIGGRLVYCGVFLICASCLAWAIRPYKGPKVQDVLGFGLLVIGLGMILTAVMA